MFPRVDTSQLKWKAATTKGPGQQTKTEDKSDKTDKPPTTEAKTADTKTGSGAPEEATGFDLASLSTACLMHLAAYVDAFGKAGGRFVIRGQYRVIHESNRAFVIDPNDTAYKLAYIGPMVQQLIKDRVANGEKLPAYVFGKDQPPEGWTQRFAVTLDDTQKEMQSAIRQWQQDDTYAFQNKHNAKVASVKHAVVTGAGEAKEADGADPDAALNDILKSPAAALQEFLQFAGKEGFDVPLTKP